MPCPAWPRELDVPYGTLSLATAPYSCPNGTLAVPAGDDDAALLGAVPLSQIAEAPAVLRLHSRRGTVGLCGVLALACAPRGHRAHRHPVSGASGRRSRRASPAP